MTAGVRSAPWLNVTAATQTLSDSIGPGPRRVWIGSRRPIRWTPVGRTSAPNRETGYDMPSRGHHSGCPISPLWPGACQPSQMPASASGCLSCRAIGNGGLAPPPSCATRRKPGRHSDRRRAKASRNMPVVATVSALALIDLRAVFRSLVPVRQELGRIRGCSDAAGREHKLDLAGIRGETGRDF